MMLGFQQPSSTMAPAAPAAPPATMAATPADRATEFTAVEGGEHYNGSTLMVVAYAAIWVLLMGWIYMLWRKQAVLGDRLDGLERSIDRAAAAAEKKAPAAKA
jgi:CcmD family protein